MPKFSVKRPYFVLVVVILLLVIGGVCFSKMSTNLFPDVSLPYMVVVTTYPGASPEKVEMDVTRVLENGLGTVSGVENVSSTSSENYSMITLEFADDVDLDSAMVKVSSAVNQMSLPETAGTPMILEISTDMMATLMVGVDYEGKDIYELSTFAEDTVIPAMERLKGVASVSETGVVKESVEVVLNQEKIDEFNEKVLEKTNSELRKAKKELEKAEKQLADGKKKLTKGEEELDSKQSDTAAEMASFSKMLNEAIATKVAYESQLSSLKAAQAALVGEKSAYKDNGVISGYEEINDSFSQMANAGEDSEIYKKMYDVVYKQVLIAVLQAAVDSQGMEVEVTESNVDLILSMTGENRSYIEETAKEQTQKTVKEQLEVIKDKFPDSVEDALNNPQKLKAVTEFMEQQGMEEQAGQLTKDNLKTLYDIVETRIPQIDTELANLKIEIKTSQVVLKQVKESIKEAEDKYEEVEAGKMTAAAAFGSSRAKLESAKENIEKGETELENSWKTFKESRKAARENANLDSLLNMETLSGILMAENFSMPAGYINDDKTQYLLKVGDTYNNIDDLSDTLLCDIEDIGEVRLGDVADITMIDNAGDSYAKINMNPAVMISVSKSSTAGTSDVSKLCEKEMKKLEKEYPGLKFTMMMDQGDYIEMIVRSVLSNLIWGAVLAIFVLALFLQDPKPTIVVAFSIPLSVMFALVLMYFTNITLNLISLSGLALGIGMLVDNSIVVVENIYRYRDKGMSAARAAVVGANQVSAAIFSSTLTTICVFLPIVFTSGITRELMQDMCLTIAYSLSASLLVALLVVPSMTSAVLKKQKERKHRFFNAMLKRYDKAVGFCLNRKWIPLTFTVVLLAFCIWQVTRIGLTMMPSMGSEQMTISLTMPDETSAEEDYALADEIMEKIQAIEGVDRIGIMSGSLMSLSSSSSTKSMTGSIMLKSEFSKQNEKIAAMIEDILGSMGLADFTVSATNMDISAITGNGAQVDIYGEDLDTRLAIGDDVMKMLGEIEGFSDISNGQEKSDKVVYLTVDKDAAMRCGLTVAQIYSELSNALTTKKTATTITLDGISYEVAIKDESDALTVNNLMEHEFETQSTPDMTGKTETEVHTLDEFATFEYKDGVTSLKRENLQNYISITATTMEGYNTTLLCRELQDKIDNYQVDDGYTIEIHGESETVNEAMHQMILMICLAVVFIYFIMVAQFQSLLSPFIVLFTMPLAFTGGLLALLITGEEISVLAMMGFLVLAGVVVNNGIVFVDYVNQLRLAGYGKREALVETGKTRMRPILMTALTTILAMSTMAFSGDMSAELGRGMAIVTIGGLAYATLMTLFIIPVMYDILYRKEMKKVDIGNEETMKEDMDLI